ncbi:MAG: hypothetical protein WCI11_05240 [Candidatus Methylumidiphilus sp.]
MFDSNNNDYPESWPLFLLAEPSGVMDLPGERQQIRADDLFKQKHVIVYAERGHRQQEFIGWLTKQLSIPSTELHLSTWDIDSSADKPSVLAQSLKALGEHPTAHRFYAVLDKHESSAREANSSREREALICKSFEVLETEIAIGFAVQLRRFQERHRQSSLHILSASSTYLPFSDKDDASGYAPLCRQYRLANYNAAELCALPGFTSLQTGGQREVITHILQETGGQPLLVKLLGQRLQRLLELEPGVAIDIDLVEKAMRQMRNSPPGECNAWKSHLKRSLEQQLGLIQHIKSYVRGETLGKFRLPPPIEELELYTGGWLAINADGRWGMTSRFHAYLASQVLDSLKEQGLC